MDSLRNTTVFIFHGLTHSKDDLLNEMKIRNLRHASKDEIEYLKTDKAFNSGRFSLVNTELTSSFEKMLPDTYFVAVFRK